ncbi:MAG: hypothetical protein KC503_38835 [Myxococcales bacterium]|nr:hypothetical protein [Myxococcales bacterium]
MSRRWILFAFTIITLSAMTTSRAHAACSANSDCKGSRVCQAGRCVDAGGCSKDSDCPGDQICSASRCSLPGAVAASALPARTPVRTVMREERILGLWLSGAIALPLAYFATIGVTAGVGGRGGLVGIACIPVFGPIAMMASSYDTSEYTGALVASTVVQIAATALLVTGIAYTRKVPTPVFALSEDTKRGPLLSILPTPIGERGFGLGLSVTRF